MTFSAQRLSRESGRVSTSWTRLPTFASFFSSCALNRRDLLTYFAYIVCFTRRSTRTTMVFCILSLTTVPTTAPRFCSELRESTWALLPAAWVGLGAGRASRGALALAGLLPEADLVDFFSGDMTYA